MLLLCHIQRESLPLSVEKVMAAQTVSSALEQLNTPKPMPGSLAAAHACKTAKRTQFRTHLSVTYVLDRGREIAKSRIVRFPDFNHGLDSGKRRRHEFALFSDVIGTRRRPVAWLLRDRHCRSRR